MVDIDNYLRSNGLPTRDANEAKRLAENINASANSLEVYLAAPDYKALAQSTTKSTGLGYFYGAATLELAKEGAITACKKYNPGHTCALVDPPESVLTSLAPASDPNKRDSLDTTTSHRYWRPNASPGRANFDCFGRGAIALYGIVTGASGRVLRDPAQRPRMPQLGPASDRLFRTRSRVAYVSHRVDGKRLDWLGGPRRLYS